MHPPTNPMRPIAIQYCWIQFRKSHTIQATQCNSMRRIAIPMQPNPMQFNTTQWAQPCAIHCNQLQCQSNALHWVGLHWNCNAITFQYIGSHCNCDAIQFLIQRMALRCVALTCAAFPGLYSIVLNCNGSHRIGWSINLRELSPSKSKG